MISNREVNQTTIEPGDKIRLSIRIFCGHCFVTINRVGSLGNIVLCFQKIVQ